MSADAPEAMDSLIHALDLAWGNGSPVAGDTVKKRERLAHLALRRIKSFPRLGIPSDDLRRQIVDLAKGLAAQLEEKPEFVGPLIKDYEHVAAALLDAYSRHAHDPDA